MAWLRRLVAAGVWLLAGLVLFSLAGRWVPAADTVANFRQFLVPVLGAVALGAVLLRLRLRLRWHALGGAAVAAIGLVSMPELLPEPLAPGSCDAGQRGCIALVQLNLSHRRLTPEPVEALVADADVLTLQELWHGNTDLITRLEVRFPEIVRCPRSRHLAVAVMTRHPVIDRGCGGPGLAWMRLDLAGEPVTVVSLHLVWPWPYGQAAQVAVLTDALAALPQPVIVAGDFNAAPWTAAVGAVETATGTRAASGLGATLSAKLPYLGVTLDLPLDQILLPGATSSGAVQRGPNVGSDHWPLVARLLIE